MSFLLFQENAFGERDLYPYLCAREVPTFAEPEYKDPCKEEIQKAKNVAGEALAKEVKDFQTEDLSALLQDNGSNSHFIAEDGVRRLRRHESCLEEICDHWLRNCSDLNYGLQSAEQKNWCDQRIIQLRDISRTQLFITTTQNQTRKNRSLLAEKFRQTSTRFRYYLHYWMTETLKDFTFFKGKIDGMIREPNHP